MALDHSDPDFQCGLGRCIGAERYRLMTPDRRMRIAASMFETARAIIESSLPLNLVLLTSAFLRAVLRIKFPLAAGAQEILIRRLLSGRVC
jgi:hypothetical protein